VRESPPGGAGRSRLNWGTDTVSLDDSDGAGKMIVIIPSPSFGRHPPPRLRRPVGAELVDLAQFGAVLGVSSSWCAEGIKRVLLLVDCIETCRVFEVMYLIWFCVCNCLSALSTFWLLRCVSLMMFSRVAAFISLA
jgi:hypothetical protein